MTMAGFNPSNPEPTTALKEGEVVRGLDILLDLPVLLGGGGGVGSS